MLSAVVLNKGFALRNAVTAVIFLKPRNTQGPASLCSGNRQEGLFFIHAWFWASFFCFHEAHSSQLHLLSAVEDVLASATPALS